MPYLPQKHVLEFEQPELPRLHLNTQGHAVRYPSERGVVVVVDDAAFLAHGYESRGPPFLAKTVPSMKRG